jgi:putative oxidoreductase
MQNILDWFEQRKDWAIEFLRMVLGIMLFLKGFSFMRNMDQLLDLVGLTTTLWVAGIFAHYIVLTHLLGGIFLTIGLITRVVAMIQLPIVFGGIIVVFLKYGWEDSSDTLVYTALVFMLLVMYLFYGGGRLSADSFLSKAPKDGQD